MNTTHLIKKYKIEIEKLRLELIRAGDQEEIDQIMLKIRTRERLIKELGG